MLAVSDLKVLLTRQQIAQRVKELGAEITRDFAGVPETETQRIVADNCAALYGIG